MSFRHKGQSGARHSDDNSIYPLKITLVLAGTLFSFRKSLFLNVQSYRFLQVLGLPLRSCAPSLYFSFWWVILACFPFEG